MSQDRLFYGVIASPNSIFATNSNSFIRIRGDFSTSSKVITNIVDVATYFGKDQIIIGQHLVASTYFPSGTIIEDINIGANTITVTDFPAATGISGVARISPPKGQYFVNSGSLTAPSNQTTDFFDITGSEDTLFQSSDNKFGILLPQASTSSLPSTIAGEFAQYEISRVVDRQNQLQASFYVTSSDSGILAEEPDKTAAANITSFVIVELSYSSSLAPIFNQKSVSSPAGGYEVAAYQIAVQEFLDDLELDILYSGSYVKGNTQFINFTGSGIQDITITESFGKTGVNVTIQGGGGADGDWFIGDTYLTSSKDIRVTGSMLVNRQDSLSDFLIITSGSYDAFKINSEGITQFFAHADAPAPWATAEYGGLYFQSSSVWAALD